MGFTVLSEYYEKRRNKIGEITGNADDSVTKAEVNKKDERLQRQKLSAWMRRKAIVYTTITALAIIIAVLIAVLVKNAINEGDSGNLSDLDVLVIDGEVISCDEFTFFCSMVLESDTFEQMAMGNVSVEQLSENVKSVAVKNAEEFICKVHEAKKAGVVLDDKEIADITSAIELASKNYKSKDEYCAKFYGLSYDEYFNFRKQAAVVNKYIDTVSSNADVGEKNQSKVYSENVKEFVSLDVKLIYMDIRGLDENEISYKKSNAETLIHYIEEGQDIGQLSETHSDENTLFNVAEHGGSDVVTLNSSIPDKYVDIYDKAFEMQVGETKLIETDSEICVIHCVDKTDFDDSLNSEKLVSHVKYEYVLDVFESAMSTGKYSASVNKDLYAKVDISDYVTTMKNAYVQEAK